MRGGPSGDLYVYLYVKPHKFFERDGNTVLCEVPINIVQATLGDEIKVPTLDGQVTMKIPEGTQPGQVLRFKRQRHTQPARRQPRRPAGTHEKLLCLKS